LLGKFTEQNIQTLVLISNLEHALLLGDETIKLQNDGLHPLIVEDQENTTIILLRSLTIAQKRPIFSKYPQRCKIKLSSLIRQKLIILKVRKENHILLSMKSISH